LPTDKNKPYHKENYTEFMGRDSPSASNYKPDSDYVKQKDP